MVDNSAGAKAKIEMLEEKARELRRKVIEVLGNSTGGHYGGALSAADALSVLYFDLYPQMTVGSGQPFVIVNE